MESVHIWVVCLLLLPCVVLGGNCSSQAPLLIPGENMMIEITGSTATLFPSVKGAPDRDSFSLSAVLFMVVERERLGNLTLEVTNDVCPFPKFEGDPLGDSYKGDPLPPIVKYEDITDYDCYTTDYIATPENGEGAQVRTIKVVMTRPSSNFRFTSLFELPNKSFIKKAYNETQYSNGVPYITRYRKGILKISYEFEGWEWGNAPNGTFLTLFSNLTSVKCIILTNYGWTTDADGLDGSFCFSNCAVTVEPGSFFFFDKAISAGFNWTKSDGEYTMFLEADQTCVLDGIAYYRLNESLDPILPLTLSERTTKSYVSGVRMCEDNIRWEHAWVDPFLGILFNGVDSLSTPSAESLPLGAKIGIGVGVGLVIVGCIVIAFFLLYSPAFQHTVLPFSKRRSKQGKGHNSAELNPTADSTRGTSGGTSSWSNSKPGTLSNVK